MPTVEPSMLAAILGSAPAYPWEPDNFERVGTSLRVRSESLAVREQLAHDASGTRLAP